MIRSYGAFKDRLAITVVNRYGWLSAHRPATIWVTVLGFSFGLNLRHVIIPAGSSFSGPIRVR